MRLVLSRFLYKVLNKDRILYQLNNDHQNKQKSLTKYESANHFFRDTAEIKYPWRNLSCFLFYLGHISFPQLYKETNPFEHFDDLPVQTNMTWYQSVKK